MQENCWNVNANGTKYLANAAKEMNAKFMYISTDYVFNGLGEAPFVETDEPHPVGDYGRTKYEAEKIVGSYYQNGLSFVYLGFLD
jgi:dTDP-4-dehydrorhamnose reductase